MASVVIKSNREQWFKQAIDTSKMFSASQIVRNLTTMLTERWRRINKEQFKAQGRGAHGKWKALSSAYAEWKQRHFPGKSILRRTDRLYNAATSGTESVGRGTRTSVGYMYRYLITVPYGEFHQDPKYDPHPSTRRIFDPDARQGKGISAAIARTIIDGLFSRAWFDARRRAEIGIVVKNTGMDRIDI
jgi:hypothetical protein